MEGGIEWKEEMRQGRMEAGNGRRDGGGWKGVVEVGGEREGEG
jgi:hypothetical protein